MARLIPSDIDELFILLFSLGFLAINWAFNVSTIYSYLTIVLLLMYILPFALQSIYPPFRYLVRDMYPMSKDKAPIGYIISIVIGVIAGFGFGFLNSYLHLASIKFAATPLLENAEMLTKLVFAVIVPFIESILFFRIAPAWGNWLIGKSVRDNILAPHKIITTLLFAGIFTVFHLTSHGLSNLETISTFIFGIASIVMIDVFKQTREAVFFHIAVNAIALGVLAI